MASSVQSHDDPPDDAFRKANGLSLMFRTAANKVLPAVVVVKAGTSPACPRCGRHHAYHHGHDLEQSLNETVPSTHSLDVLGSGFVVDPSGIVLTNKHVATAGDRLVVQMADGKQFLVKAVKRTVNMTWRFCGSPRKNRLFQSALVTQR